MGGAQSYFNETDWDLADGSLRTGDDTMDGRPPTVKYQTYDLVKRSIVANQRELDVTDSEKNLLFHVRPSPGTIAGFDVLGIGSANNDDYLLRVTVDLARRYWIIYRFDKPIFDGQKPDPIATEKFAIEQQTATNERKELAARISASLAIHSFSDDTPIEEAPKPVPIVPKHFLYKVGCVTVSWSRYMAVAAYYGPPTIDQIMQATEAACKKDMQSKRKTTSDGHDTDDDDGDILNEARKIAGRLREEREGLDESQRSDSATATTPNVDSNDLGVVLDAAAPIPVAESNIPLIDDSEINIKKDLERDSMTPTTDGTVGNVPHASENALIAIAASNEEPIETNPNIEEKDMLARHHSLADDLVDESESDVDLVHDGSQPIISESLSHQERANECTSVQKIDALDIQTSVSMPELSEKAAVSPSTIGNGIQKWWQENSRSLHEKSIAMLRPKGMSEDFTATSASPATLDTSGSSRHSGTGTTGNDGSTGVASSFLGMGKSSTVDDPLQGVVHLDKPLLLCQEIYTRIIGNHQTSKVSKEKVLTLLRQDMEQHLQTRKEDDELENVNKDVAMAVNTSSLNLTQNSDTSSQSGSAVSELNTSALPVDIVANNTSADSSGKTTDGVDSNNVEPPGNLDATPVPPPVPPLLPTKEQPLVGYWVWENSLRTHKMKMHLAKGSDLALHIVLAVLVNQLRYERNAIAIAV